MDHDISKGYGSFTKKLAHYKFVASESGKGHSVLLH